MNEWGLKKYLTVITVLLFTSQAFAIKRTCEERWTPEYELSDLIEVQTWAAIGVFVINAEEAGVEFDRSAYLDDCPSWILFNFGRATATSCLEVDVLSSYISLAWAFQNKKRNLVHLATSGKKESFREFYLKKAKESGALKYIIE